MSSQDGVYARDLQIIDFWNRFEKVRKLPAPVRYRLPRDVSPRRHWALAVQDEELLQEMLRQQCLMLGPETSCNLTDIKEIKGGKLLGDARDAIKARFQDLGVDLHSKDVTPLVYFLCKVCDGNLVALVRDQRKVVAVGVVAGGYRFQPGKCPHQIPVVWLHKQAFLTSSDIGPGLTKLNASSGPVAEIEASVLAFGELGWCDFRKTAQKAAPSELRPPPLGSEAPGTAAPPRLTGMEREVEEMLARKGQVILYGPPGTGKTYHAERVALELIARANFSCTAAQLGPQQRCEIGGKDGTVGYLSTCTFHPMYSYEDFVEGYRPIGEGGFRLVSGIFRRVAEAASKMPRKQFVLVVDEINRGNIPKIFGELITLLELSKRESLYCSLPLSQEPFTVPRNLWIIGTMNTADRSISLLDTALRRRFAFKELMPQPQLLAGIDGLSLETWLRALNRRIVKALGRDSRNLQVGHAYLLSVTSLDDLAKVIRYDLWPLLQEYCYEDPTKLVAILGKLFDQERADLNWKLFQSQEELRSALEAMTDQEDTIADPEEEPWDEGLVLTEDDEEALL
jgi:5-methylcytosine-specific restriction protein B